MPALPPGPGAPRVVQAWRWTYRPIALMRECSTRYGDAFTLRLPHYEPIVMISSPETIAAIFRDSTGELRSGEGNRLFEPLLGSRSLILMDGAEHRREQRLLMPMFRGERMRAYGPTMRRAARRRLEGWPATGTLAMQPEMQAITLDVILAAVFGMERSERLSRLREHLVRLLDLMASATGFFATVVVGERALSRLDRTLGRGSPAGILRRRLEPVDTLLFDELRERRGTAEGGDDILSLMLQARTEDGRPLDDRHLRDALLTLLVAGHETTATALSWCLYRLARHPQVAERARAEILQAPQTDDGSAADAPYLDAVIRETLRLHPIVPFVVRKLVEDRRFGGLELPAGSIACPSIWLTQRRPDVWPEPERFDPQRFLGGKVSPSAYLPFGGGNRTCLGMAFARFEMKLVLEEVLTSFRLGLPEGFEPRLVRRGVTFAPSRGGPVVVRSTGENTTGR